jgi:hypothetical protein
MMSIQVKGTIGGSSFAMKFTCPHCGCTEKLRNMMPRACFSCCKPIPNLFALLYSPKERAIWHNEGDKNASMHAL